MAISTTQSIWRSGGGDQSRTAYCGSGLMAAQFYVANAAVTSATNVKVSSAANAAVLTLPQGAVVVSVSLTDAGTGHVDLGYDAVNNSNAAAATIALNLDVSAVGTTSIGSVVTGTALPDLAYVTVTKNSDGAGTVGGVITYFVTDPLVGQQNV